MPQKMIQSIYHFHSKEGINMNKIYKVIWSKAKHTYVVASEIAKGHTKGETTGRGLKKLAAALLVAAALLSPNFAWAADTVTVTDPTTSTTVEVYTKDAANNKFATSDQLQSDVAATNAEVAKKANQVDLEATNANVAKKANQVDLEATNANVAKKANQTDLDATNENLAQKADKATTLEGYGITDAYTKTEADGKFATVDQLQADVAATNEELVKKADKATTLAGYGITDAYTKAEVDTADANLQKAIDEEARKRKYSVTNLENADKQLQTNIDTEKTARESADSALDSRTSALEAKTGSLNRVAAANSTSINESMTLKDKQYSATLQVNGSGAQIGVVNNEAAGLANDGGTAYTEYRARTGAIVSKATNDISSTSSNGQIIDTAGDTTGEYSQAATKSTGTTFTYSNDGGKTSSSTTIKGNSVSTGTVSATAGITDGTTKDGTSVIASQTVGQNLNALDERITNVKEYLEKQTSDTYVSKDDAAVQDGAIVKADKTIGENVTNLDAALAKETAARLGADKAQDKVIQQVNQNMVDGFNTINTNMANGFAALNAADAAEKEARIGADKKLAEAVNSGLSLRDDNVLQKNTTTVADDGTVTTSKSDANEMILNKGNKNQITLNEKGVKVGTNSSVMDADGIYTGGDTFDAAKAAMSSDGQIKGANGKFTVDASGNTTVTSLDAGTGTIQTKGDIYAKDATFSGDITAKDATLSGDLSAKDGTFSGDLSAKDGTFSGDVSAKDVTATGTLQGAEVTDGTATMKNGNITGVKNLSAETITTSGDATIGGDLTVKGKLNVDEIDLTKSGIVGDNNVTASTKVAAGEIISYKKATSTKDGSEKESAINYNENGTSTWAIATDADKKWNKSTLTVEGSDVTSKVIDSDKNSNISTQTASESNSTITGTADGKNYKSYITQNLKNILQGIKEGTNESIVDQTETGIKSTATDGKNTASTNLSNKGFNTYATDGTNRTYTLQTAESLTSQIGDDGKVKSVMNADGITNNADGGTITNSAKDLVNTATGNMTNTVGGEMKTTVTGKVTEDFKSDLTTTIGGNKSEEVKGTSTETVTGKKTENYNSGLETTVTGEEKHTVNGSQTNAITGDQTNTIGGSQTTTVTGDVTEDYKANLSTTVGGSQTTTVTGDSSLTAENINNTAKNKITNKALDVETDAASSIVSKVSNDAGSNTSTQLSYQTKEEMSQADGKTASYLRGAAEEKSQLIDGDKKTTIDTIAGQTNTNITDGTNISNSLQKADQAASSVTDGTNTTVVNQNAKSLASSITDGTKANNTNSTVDKSEQLIKDSDTQYSATTKTASKTEDALVSGGSVIDVIKNLDDAANPFIGSAVTDGTNSTGVTQTAKDITNTAEKGTIANNAKDITNNATENMTNTVGKDLTTTVGGEMKTNVTGDSSLTAKNINNTATEALTNDAKTITNKASESVTTQIGDGSAVKSVMNGDGIANTATDKAITNDAATITNTGTTSVTNQVGKNKVLVDTTKVQSVYGDTIYTTWDANGITNNAADKTVATTAKDIKNTATGDITNTASNGTITNDAKTLLNKASESITDKVGDNVERTMTTKQIQDKVGKTTVTTIDGKTKLTNEDGTHRTEMDFADVLKDLGVRGNATVDGNTTLGTDGNDTLTVNSTSTFKEKVTMEKDLNVKSEVLVNEGDKNQVRINTNGITVGLNSTVVDSEGVYVGGHTFEAAKAGMDKDGKLKAASGNFQVDTKGNVSAVSYTVKDTNIKIDNTGINAGGTKVTGLASADISHAGSTDAVSGGQLYETNTRVSGLETRMGTVETRVDKLDNKIDKVGANAAAMANLHPLEFDEDSKWNVAAAVGSSGSETASAVGVFYRPNENVMVNASAAMGTGENMFGGGVSLRLGHGGNKAKEAQMKAAVAENKELRAKVDDLTARMDALLSVLNPNMSKDFPDVPENHWAYEAVSRLAGNGIVEGYEDGKYHGERQMTRYEMAEIIYNALSKGAKAEKKLVEEFRPELQAMAAQKKA